VSLVPHPESGRIARAIERCQPLTTGWKGILFRSASPEFATVHDLLTGAGSKRLGGRWNPKGIAAVYGSLDPMTAMAETLAHHRHYDWPLEEALPRVFVSIRGTLHHVLDITDGKVRHTLGISAERLAEEPWRELQDQGREARTQSVGRGAWEAGFEALLVPSARGAGTNLVFFPDRRHSESSLEIIHGEQLPAQRRRRRR
jgi:RES domain-containing protein